MYDSSYNKHQCRVAGCDRMISHQLLMCPLHWAMVPTVLQHAIYNSYRRRDESDQCRQSYLNDVRDACEAVRKQTMGPESDMVLITGRSYPVRDQLKAIGGRWSPAEKGWRVPRDQKMVAEVLVGNAEQVETLPGMEAL